MDERGEPKTDTRKALSLVIHFQNIDIGMAPSVLAPTRCTISLWSVYMENRERSIHYDTIKPRNTGPKSNGIPPITDAKP